jgi:hypothetical protein
MQRERETEREREAKRQKEKGLQPHYSSFCVEIIFFLVPSKVLY